MGILGKRGEGGLWRLRIGHGKDSGYTAAVQICYVPAGLTAQNNTKARP